jgi:hypothetical protein
MTVGVKIVQYPIGTAVITEDLQGYTPKAVLFLASYADAAGGTRSFGASDGTSQWSCSDWRRASLISRFSADGGRFGGATRTDRCLALLGITGTTTRVVGLDTSCHVTSFASNKINLTWDGLGTAGGGADGSGNIFATVGGTTVAVNQFTMVIFYGPMFTAKAGVCGASSADDSAKITTTFDPGCVIMSDYSRGNVPQAFATAAPSQDTGIFATLNFGWATFPEPAFDPATGAAGTTNTTRFGQQTVGSETLAGAGLSCIQGYFTHNVPYGNTNSATIKHFSDGFCVKLVTGSSSNTNGYLALNWDSGRFVSGFMPIPSGSSGGSFGQWGGTFNSSHVDTNPSGHAHPSFLLLQGIDSTTSGSFDTNPQSWAVAAIDPSTVGGWTYSGTPDGNPSLPLATATIATAIRLSAHYTLLDSDGVTVNTQMDVTSWDGDGITVSFLTHPPRNQSWPYLALANDVGVLNNTAAMTDVEAPDVFEGSAFADFAGISFAVTELPDIFGGSTVITDDVTMTSLEEPDVFASGGYGHGVSSPEIGEYIYVPFENQVYKPFWDQDLPILRTNDAELTVNSEDRSVTVPADIKLIYVPPVESGSWF